MFKHPHCGPSLGRERFNSLVVAVQLTAIVLSFCAVARAHTKQIDPAQVLIYPRRDYLTLQISGIATDLLEADSGHESKTQPSSSVAADLDSPVQRRAADYLESHIFLEQDGQVLPIAVRELRYWSPDSMNTETERFEAYARAERPSGLAKTPLRVGSDLFSHLTDASTVVELGGQRRTLVKKQVVEFPAAETLPTLGGDLKDFGWSGLLQVLGGLAPVLFVALLVLSTASFPNRWLVFMMVALVLGELVTFSLSLFEVLKLAPRWLDVALAFPVVLAGGTSWFLARRTEESARPLGWDLLALAEVGGLAYGCSGAPALARWGMPEDGPFLCILAYGAGMAVGFALLAAALRAVVLYGKAKFTHAARYGGMPWSRVAQFVSLGGLAVGLFWIAQRFTS